MAVFTEPHWTSQVFKMHVSHFSSLTFHLIINCYKGLISSVNRPLKNLSSVKGKPAACYCVWIRTRPFCSQSSGGAETKIHLQKPASCLDLVSVVWHTIALFPLLSAHLFCPPQAWNTSTKSIFSSFCCIWRESYFLIKRLFPSDRLHSHTAPGVPFSESASGITWS